MELDITIKNYRCFPESTPARITISDGFQALVGVNNSGKSSLLRFFYEFRSLFSTIGGDFSAFLQMLRGDTWHLDSRSSVSDPGEIFNNRNDHDIQIIIAAREADRTGVLGTNQADRVEITGSRTTKRWTTSLPGHDTRTLAKSVNNREGNYFIGPNPGVGLTVIQRTFSALADSLYVGPFRNAINIGSNADYYDIKVGQAFIGEWREHKTGQNIRRNEAALRLTDDIRRIFEFDRLEIDASNDGSNLKVFVNNRSFKLTELGAGLTQFILVLANAAVRKPYFILIDEPETNLHPSLQIDFLTTLASYAKEGLVFGTHSIGLARALATRIYSLRRAAEGQTEVRDFEATLRLAEFVGELGYSGYQDLGYDKILLVEGPTDVTTFQQFLRIYGKDHKIVMLPLGGRSFITAASGPQLAELRRISERIQAAIDSERQAPGELLPPGRQAFVDECARVGIACHVLERRATENYFTDSAVKAAKGESYRALGPFEDRAGVSPVWHKRENWKVAREMRKSDLDTTDLGQLLEAL